MSLWMLRLILLGSILWIHAWAMSDQTRDALISKVTSDANSNCIMYVSQERTRPFTSASNPSVIMITNLTDRNLMVDAKFQCLVLVYHAKTWDQAKTLMTEEQTYSWNANIRILFIVEERPSIMDSFFPLPLLDHVFNILIAVPAKTADGAEYLLIHSHIINPGKSVSNIMRDGKLLQDQFESFPKGIPRLDGRVVETKVEPYPPFVTVNDEGKHSGFEYEAIEEVFKGLGATVEVLVSKIHLGANGTGTDDVWKHRIMFVGSYYCCETPSLFSSHIYLDSATPFWRDSEGIMGKLFPPGQDWLQVVRPLEPNTWIFFIGSLLGVIVILLVILKATRYQSSRSKLNVVTHGVLAPLIFQSANVEEKKLERLRIFFALYFLACVVISFGYTGTLISFLTIPGEAKSFQSIQEVLDAKVKVAAYPYSISFLITLGRPELIQLKSIIQPIETFDTEVDDLNDLSTVFLGSKKLLSGGLRHWKGTSDHQEDFYFVPEVVASALGGPIFGKPNPYKIILDRAMARLLAAGIPQRIEKKWTELTPRPPPTGGRRMKVNEIQAALVLLAVGVGISLIIFIIEMIIGSRKKQAWM